MCGVSKSNRFLRFGFFNSNTFLGFGWNLNNFACTCNGLVDCGICFSELFNCGGKNGLQFGV